jgi:hypothetical protein
MATVTKGRTFVSGEIITPAKLNNVVDLATVTDIQTADIADGQITTAKILDANVTDAKLATGIDASKLTTGTLPADRIGADAITTARILNANVTPAKLAAKVTFPNYVAATAISYVSGTIYQAATDGYLLVNVLGQFRNGIEVYAGTTSPPTLLIWGNGDDINSNTKRASSGLLPITKDAYYRVINSSVGGGNEAFETVNITWLPIHS